MVGGVLTERTVGHVLPALEETQTGVPFPLLTGDENANFAS
jgi:hypothetical protein